MQAAPTRYVSVSELYEADEVELLLDEIRDLEPTSCRGEDIQDLEISGSGVGGGGGGLARSPCGTSVTERSWDSHAQYSRAPAPRPRAVAPLYWHARHLRTPAGGAALLVALAGGGACACVLSAAGLRWSWLPLASRVRLLLLGALTSLLLQGALLAAHVTRLSELLPLRWDRLAAATCAWSACSLLAGGALVLHALALTPEYRHAPPALSAPLYAGAGLALGGGAVALAAAGGALRACLRAQRPARPPPAHYRAVPRDAQDDPL